MWLANNESTYATVGIGSSDDSYYVGQAEFDPGEDISICKVVLDPNAVVGDTSGRTFYVQVWTMSGTSLDVLQGESDGVAGSAAWDFSPVDFEFSTPVDLSNGTDYCIVVTMKAVSALAYAQIEFTDAKTGFDGYAAYWNSSKEKKSPGGGIDFKCEIYTD